MEERDALKAFPHPVAQPLHWPERRLIGHFSAFGDPIAEVQVGQTQRRAALDLPQDVVGPEARSPDSRLEKGIDG